MSFRFVAVLGVIAAFGTPVLNAEDTVTAAVQSEEASADALIAQENKDAAYLLGLMDAQGRLEMFENTGIEGKEDYLAGIKDAVEGKDPRVDPAQADAIFDAVRARIQNQQQAAEGNAAADNLAKGQAYLEGLKGKEGVTFTDSGIAYEVLKAGDGANPVAADTVKVHYVGTLIDGTEFDSSRGRGEPATFPLNRVIPGWTEGLQLMPVGATYRFHIPSDLAYGPSAPPSIGPNQVLIFEVELLEIMK